MLADEISLENVDHFFLKQNSIFSATGLPVGSVCCLSDSLCSPQNSNTLLSQSPKERASPNSQEPHIFARKVFLLPILLLACFSTACLAARLTASDSLPFTTHSNSHHPLRVRNAPRSTINELSALGQFDYALTSESALFPHLSCDCLKT